MRARLTQLGTAAGLCALTGAALWFSTRLPEPLPATAPPIEFSAERATRHLTVIAHQPHPSGSTEHVRVREYLQNALAGLGLEPRVQEAIGVGTHNAVAGRIWNIMARLPGRQTGTPAVLLAAHYDTVPASPGAGDDGASVAIVLETLRALRAGPPLAHDVIALFTDGEEAGLTGSAAFVRDDPWARDAAVVLNFEGRGTGGLSEMFQTGSGNLDTIRTLRRIRGVSTSSLFTALVGVLPNDTDLSEFLLLGLPALNFAFSDGLERYHSAEDDAAHLNAASVQHQGMQALALARAFADGALPRPRNGDAVFFSVPGAGTIVYPIWMATPLVLLAGVLLLITAIRRRRREPLTGDVLVGATGTAATTVAGAAVAYAASAAMQRLFGVALDTEGSAASRGLCAVGLTLLVVSSVSGGWLILRRRANAAGAHLGALVLWFVVALAVAWMVPGASYLFVWPLLASSIAAMISSFTNHRRIWFAVTWAAAVVAIFIIAPVVRSGAIVAFGFGTPGWIVIGLALPFAMLLLAPHLEALTLQRQWKLPLAGAILAVAFFAAGAAAFAWNPSRIKPTQVAYAYDADSHTGWLIATPEYAPPGSWGAAVVGSQARMVSPGAPSAEAAPPGWLTRAIGSESPTLAAPTQNITRTAPDLRIVTDQSTAAGRRLALRVIPAPGTYSIRIRALNTAVRSAVVDGHPIDESHRRFPSAQWSLGYVQPSPQGFDLVLDLTSQNPIDLDLIARSLGLPAELRDVIPARPADVSPVHAGEQTVVHRHVRF